MTGLRRNPRWRYSVNLNGNQGGGPSKAGCPSRVAAPRLRLFKHNYNRACRGRDGKCCLSGAMKIL